MELPVDEKVVNLAQLPDDPLTMPPPYWRGSGALFQLLDALEELVRLLTNLIPIHARTEIQLNAYYAKQPDDSSGPDWGEFTNICDELWDIEHRIKLKADLAILMSAIQGEDTINEFCVYNLHKNIAETIEKLSLSEKLLIASSVVGKHEVKSQSVFEAVKKLVSWRNAFAHGHCVDRPVKSLRHNHLIDPEQYPGVPDSVIKVKDLVSGFVKLCDYLCSISINPYTSEGVSQVDDVRQYLKEIDKFHFDVSSGINDIYLIVYNEK